MVHKNACFCQKYRYIPYALILKFPRGYEQNIEAEDFVTRGVDEF